MNIIQRKLLYIFSPLILFILLLDNLYPGQNSVRYFKLLTIFLLLFAASIFKKKYHDQKVLNLALFFVTAGDTVFVLCHGNPGIFDSIAPLGAIGFVLAYFHLINVFQKNSGYNMNYFFALLPVLGLYIPVLIKCYKYINGQLFYGLLLFSFILCYMSWRSLCTFFEGYYTLHTCFFMALAGYLILISDTVVGMAVYMPFFSGRFNVCLENIIWGTFITAWLFIVVIIAEDNLIK